MEKAHATRLKFYADRLLNVTTTLLDSIELQQRCILLPASITNHRYQADSMEYQVFVTWQGFSDVEASWEPLVTLFEDTPHLVAAYISSIPKTCNDRTTWLAPLLKQLQA